MNQSTSFAQVATNQFDYLSSALCANTPPCKKHSSSRKFLTLSISLRLLLVMFVALTVTTNAWGAEVTFLPNELTPVTSKDYSLTKENVKIAVTASTVTSEQFRIFKNQTITITSTGGTITNIKFTCTANNTSQYGPGCLTVGEGNYSYSNKVGTWTGSATEIIFTASTNQVRATEIVVTTASSTPTLTTATEEIDFSNVAINSTNTQTFTFSGSNLTADATLAITGTNKSYFSVNTTTVPHSSGSINNKSITVTYKPTATGEHTATLTISSTNATSKTIELIGNALQEHTVKFFSGGEEVSSKNVLDGSTIGTLPSATSCDQTNYPYFIGWTEGTIDGTTTTKPTIITTSTTIKANKEYHAVFADKQPSSGTGTSGSTTFAPKGSSKSSPWNDNGSIWTFSNITFVSSATAGFPQNGTATVTLPTGAVANTITITRTTNAWSNKISLLVKTGSSTIQTLTQPNTTTTINLTSANQKNTYTFAHNNAATNVAYVDNIKINYTISSTPVAVTYITSCTTETAITLYANDGTNQKTDITTGEKTYTVPTCSFSRTGYNFVKWNTKADGTGTDYNPDATINLNGTAVNLYAIWTPIKYTITYELDGGTNHASNPANYTIETEAIALQNPSKQGCDFVGWYKESTFATQVTQIAKGSTGNITLYAKWEEIPTICTVTYNANGGEGTTPTDTKSPYNSGAIVTVEGNYGKLTKDGYAFTGWNTAADGSGTPYKNGDTFTITGNTTLYAQWCEAYWKLVTNASELEDDTRIIIAAKDYNVALSTTQNTINRGQATITKKYNTVTFGDDVQTLSLVGLSNNLFALYTGSEYLYAASSSANQLKTGGTNNGNGFWSIAINQGVARILAQGDKTHNQIKYNHQQSGQLFSCYESTNTTMSDVVIYKEVCKQDSYEISENLSNATAANTNAKTVLASATSLSLKYSAADGYLLPETITVKMGGVALSSTDNYTWDKETGELTITVTGFYGDIDVVIEAEADPCYGFEMSEVEATSTSTSITLSWNEVEGATGYKVKLNEGEFTDATGISHTFEGLEPNTSYNWKVQAIKDGADFHCETSQTGSTTTQKETYTITWNAAGEETTTTVTQGEAVTLPETPASCSSTYTTFVGWFTAAAGAETSPSNNLPGTQVTASTVPTGTTTYYAVWADGSGSGEEVKRAELDFSSNTNWGIPSGSGNKTVTANTYSNGTYSIILEGSSGNGYYYNSNQVLLGKQGAYLTLPAFDFKVSKIVSTTPTGTVSGKVTWNVYSGDEAVSTFVTGCTSGGTFEIDENHQAVGTVYTIKVTNDNNLQIKKLEIYEKTSAVTGYISSCCQSQAVVTVAPQATELALNIDGTASTTVNISQTGAGSGKFYPPTITPDGASVDFTTSFKTKDYSTTFTATKTGTYTITADFTETEAACPRYGTATINVVANPILVVSEPTISSQCGTASVPVAVTIDSRYLTGSSLTAQVATTASNGQFEICKTENGTFATTYLTGIAAGQDEKASETIYVRYVADVDDITPAEGSLTIYDGTTTKTVTLNTTPTCGTSIRMTASDANSIRVATANGQWTRTQTPIQLRGAYLLQNLEAGQGAKVVLTSSNSNFKFVKPDVQSAGTATFESEKITTETWEQNIHLVYTPTTYDANETTTITAKVITFGGNTEHASSTMEAYGRSFPETFVLALNTGDGWVALPADMTAPYGTSCNTGVGTHDPYPITVDDEANPTAATLAPARAVYKGTARNTPMTNPWTIQLESNELTGYYLFGSNNTNNTISNSNQATGEGIKWALSTSDNITYQLSQTTVTEGQKLGYNGTNKVMGQYKSAAVTYKYDFRILPIDGTICTYFVKPVLTLVSFDDNNITYTTPYDGTLNYKISADGGNTWTELTGVLDCKTLSFTLPVATYRGKTIIVKPNAAEEDCVTVSDPIVIPNPTIDRGETPWHYTGVVGKPFSDNSKSITINDLQNALNVAVIQQVTNSNISASITPEGVVTVSMDAADATEGEHKAVLEFTSAGAEAKQVGVVITIKSLATQEFDGGNEFLFTESTPIVLCHNEMISLGETPTVYLSYPLYMNGSPITDLGQFNQTSLTLTDLTSGISMAAVSREMNGNGVVKLTFGNSITDDLIVGHMYRLSWENTNQVMTDQIGLPYTDCVMDFVFSENCDAPTALQACPVTNSGFTANWAPVQDCDGNVTVEVYTKGEVATLLDKTFFSTTEVKDLQYVGESNLSSNYWVTNIDGTKAGAPSIDASSRLLISDVSSPKYYNLFSPQLSNFGSFDESTTYTITITLYQATNDAGAGAYFYVMDNGSDLKKSTTPTITDKTVLIDEQSVTNKKLTYGTTIFTVKGLSSDDRIRLLGFESSSIATKNKNVYISSIKIEGPGAGDVVATKNVSCAAGSVEFTGLDANTQYYYTVSDGANTSREIAVKTYNNDPQVKFYDDENNTKELVETVVVDGKTTTVFVTGQNISGCESDDVVAYASNGYRVNCSALVYDPKTATISGSVELTITEPSVINGTLTIKDGVNQTYNLPIVSGSNMELQVVEWKASSAVVMYNGDPEQSAQMTINGVVVGSVTLSNTKKDIAVYELPFAGLNTNPNQYLTITINDKKTLIQAPYIVSEGNTAAVPANADMVVLKGQTFTANGETLNNVTIYGGGKLVVPADKGFGVNTLTLRIGGVTPEGNYDYVYPEFDLKGAYSNTSGKINLDYVTTKSQYYTFVAPFAVETKDIKYPVDIYGSNVNATNRGSFEFQYYDGAARAAGEKGWKVVEEDPTDGATLTAHQGYTFYGMPKKVNGNRQKFGIHRIPMSIGATKVMEHENSEQTTTVSAYPSQHNINAGWNLIGNPYMATIKDLNNNSIQTGTIVLVDDRWQWSNEADQYNHRFIVFPSNDGESYYTSQASNATLPAFKNFFVQIAGENVNALSIPFTHRAPSPISARRAAQDSEEDIELAIVLEKDAAHADQLDFLVNDAYTAVYDYNADFTKMMNNTQLNLFGLLMEDNLSFVAVDHLTAKTDLAIGYQVPQAGEYTLRLSEKPYVMWSRVDALYVTDHEVYPEVTTNLLEDDYTFQVGNAETNITRFTISIIPSKESSGTTTGVDNLLHHDMQPQKFIYNDQLYILRDGVVYDAMGQRIMTINK